MAMAQVVWNPPHEAARANTSIPNPEARARFRLFPTAISIEGDLVRAR